MGREAAAISAVAVLVAGVATLALVETGYLSRQMVLHVAIMNVAAPLAAAWTPARPTWTRTRGFLVGAALGQLILLWSSHLPTIHHLASMRVHLAMAAVLAVAAFAFWVAVVSAIAKRHWPAIAALLLTGKLACLLGALLIFAPGEIYGLPVEDQHLAGLFMVTACPLSYVTAAIVLAAQAVADLERGGRCAEG